ncbi:MAG: ubiquinol-cytochrome c reductase iron-sulfur subunit N-terminal domain-containing protein [Planctomycetota bacterium]
MRQSKQINRREFLTTAAAGAAAIGAPT